MDVIVNHKSGSKQFVAIIEGTIASLSYTTSSDGKIWDYYSTYVPTSLRGKRIGQTIVKYALDFAKENSLIIIPTCPFVKGYIDIHPEYKALVYK